MKYYLVQIGNGLYYNQKKDTFTCYDYSATWYKDKEHAQSALKWLKDAGVIVNVVDYEVNK